MAPTGALMHVAKPASEQTSGHGTTGSMAQLFAEPLAAFLKEVRATVDRP